MVVLMIDGHGESRHQPTVQLTQQWQNAPGPGSAEGQAARAVPRFLTPYVACTPCTASGSHVAWDVYILRSDT
jgi:hypothetical protein